MALESSASIEPLAGRFSRLREQAGLTQSALAAPRYTVSYVSQIEAGRRTPSDDALSYFAERLGVAPSYLRTGIPDDLGDKLAYRIEEGYVQLRSGEPTGALEIAIAIRDESEHYGLENWRSRALVLAANALATLGRTREAIDKFEEALEDGLTERERGAIVAGLAAAYRKVGDLSYAADLIESELRGGGSAPLDPAISAELHTGLLAVYFERGDVTKAERVAERALAAASEGATPSSRANVLWAASRVLAEAKRWDEALEFAREARSIIEGLNDKYRLARVHSAYADLCLESDPPRLEEAAKHLESSEEILGRDGPPRELAYVHIEQGRLALLSQRPADALTFSERALELDGDDPLQRAECLFVRGRALAELEQREAESCLVL
jgi:tetratricopeptide (TPR) repeat protein